MEEGRESELEARLEEGYEEEEEHVQSQMAWQGEWLDNGKLWLILEYLCFLIGISCMFIDYFASWQGE